MHSHENDLLILIIIKDTPLLVEFTYENHAIFNTLIKDTQFGITRFVILSLSLPLSFDFCLSLSRVDSQTLSLGLFLRKRRVSEIGGFTKKIQCISGKGTDVQILHILKKGKQVFIQICSRKHWM